jgi:hypothetical protein
MYPDTSTDGDAAPAGSSEEGSQIGSGMENTVLPRRARIPGVLASGLSGGPRLALIAWVSTLALVVTALLLGFLTPDFLLPFERFGSVHLLVPCLLALANSSVGALVDSRQPRNRMGWVFCGIGLLYGLRCLAEAYADYALLARPGLALGELAAWASTWLRFPVIALVALVVLLFPHGRMPSSRWRTVDAGAMARRTLHPVRRFGADRGHAVQTSPGRGPRTPERLCSRDGAGPGLCSHTRIRPVRGRRHVAADALAAGPPRGSHRRGPTPRVRLPGGIPLRHLLSPRGERRTRPGTAREGRGLRERFRGTRVLLCHHAPGGLQGSP